MLARLQGRYHGQMPVECRRRRLGTLAFAWIGCFPFAVVSLAGAGAYAYWLTQAWSGGDLGSLLLCGLVGLLLSAIFAGQLRGQPEGCVRPYFERSPGAAPHPALGWPVIMSMRLFDDTLRDLHLPTLSSMCFADVGDGEPPQWFDAADGVRSYAALVSRLREGRVVPRYHPRRTLEDLEQSLVLMETAESQGIRFCLLLQYAVGKSVYDKPAERAGAFH